MELHVTLGTWRYLLIPLFFLKGSPDLLHGCYFLQHRLLIFFCFFQRKKCCWCISQKNGSQRSVWSQDLPLQEKNKCLLFMEGWYFLDDHELIWAFLLCKVLRSEDVQDGLVLKWKSKGHDIYWRIYEIKRYLWATIHFSVWEDLAKK